MCPFNPFAGEEVALRYHQWYEKPPGSNLAKLERKALSYLLSPPCKGALLEVGCGTGYFTAYLAELGFSAVGLDSSLPMLKAARERYAGIPFLLGSAESLPFLSHSFDMVAFITSLEFIDDPRRALREADRVARSALLFGIMNRWSPYVLSRRIRPVPPYRQAHFYSLRELRGLLQSCLKRPFRATWATAILSPRWGCAPSHFPGGGFIALRVDLEDPRRLRPAAFRPKGSSVAE
jgi:ubiquinone/menaquinone biosynthesis C-methylase UbiE